MIGSCSGCGYGGDEGGRRRWRLSWWRMKRKNEGERRRKGFYSWSEIGRRCN